MNNLYEVLEVCLQDIDKGADLETVLFRYPELADELRPILQASVAAKSIAVPEPTGDVVRRNRAKVLQRAAQLREAKAAPSRRFWTVPLRRALVSLAVIAVLFASSTGLVRAASSTLPGDNLYPVKRTWEDVLVLFTFNAQNREALEVEHENERLDELNELFARRRSAKVDFAGLVTRQTGDLWRVSGIPVVIPAQADVRGQVTVGDAVRVRGITQIDGSVLAERVDVLGVGVPLPDVEDGELEIDDDSSGKESPQVAVTESADTTSRPRVTSLQGTVDSINGNIVVVDGLSMNISYAEIKGQPGVGRHVKVEGYYDTTGVFIVTKIEFLQTDSSGSNSGSDDGNDSNDDHSNDNDNSSHDGGGGGSDDNSNDHSGSGSGGDG